MITAATDALAVLSPHYKLGDGASGPHCERRHYAKPWIIVRTDLYDDPRVLWLSELTGEKRVTVVGCLHRLWSLAALHTTNGRFKGMTAEALDRLCEVPGFAKALEQVGWLKADDPWVSVPRFEKWMSGTAKRRALKNARQARTRQRKRERATAGERGASVGAGAPTREEGETESETVRRVREKEKESETKPETETRDEAASDSGLPASFLSAALRTDSGGCVAKMSGTDRRRIQAIGQLRIADNPDLHRLRDELLALKKHHDENDPNTANKLLTLWAYHDLPAAELRRIIDLAGRYGRKRFAYAVGLAKKRIGARVWEAY
jgi:hypothetical protein